VQLLHDAVRHNIRNIEFGWKSNFAERHGHKPMTLSNRFNLRATWRGVRRVTGREEGSALSEFSFAWLFLLGPVLVGVIYGGITFYDYAVLANAVVNGAKTLADSRWAGANSKTNQNACQLAQAQVQATAYGLNTTSLPICTGTCSPGIALPTFSTATGSTAVSTCDAMQQGELGTVTATYPCNMYFPKLGINLCNASSQMITAQTTIRIE
jgi:Flp pilus assembly protein TadG